MPPFQVRNFCIAQVMIALLPSCLRSNIGNVGDRRAVTTVFLPGTCSYKERESSGNGWTLTEMQREGCQHSRVSGTRQTKTSTSTPGENGACCDIDALVGRVCLYLRIGRAALGLMADIAAR